MKTRFTKVIRDLTSDYPKNLMLTLAIGLGVFGIGSILGGYGVIKREMTDNYLGTSPASAMTFPKMSSRRGFRTRTFLASPV